MKDIRCTNGKYFFCVSILSFFVLLNLICVTIVTRENEANSSLEGMRFQNFPEKHAPGASRFEIYLESSSW